LSEIKDYTFTQIDKFLEAIKRLEKKDKIDRLHIGSLANRGNKEAIEQYMFEMEK